VHNQFVDVFRLVSDKAEDASSRSLSFEIGDLIEAEEIFHMLFHDILR
jgi:hypothetical protein